MRVLKCLCGAAALTMLLAPGARADEWNKKTILTFSGPVQIPGATLPAGSYVFKLADIPSNRHVVQVFDKDEKKIYTTILAIPNDRLEPSDKPVVLFSERASGSPQAVKVWYYPGERVGNEFVYPKSQAMRIAKETHQRVLATNDDRSETGTAGVVPESMKTADLGYFDEGGAWHATDDKVAVNDKPAAADQSKPMTNTAASTTGAAPSRTTGTTARNATTAGTTAKNTTSSQSVGTTGARGGRKSLPRTSSSLALFELLSGLSLAGGFVARSLRSRL